MNVYEYGNEALFYYFLSAIFALEKNYVGVRIYGYKEFLYFKME